VVYIYADQKGKLDDTCQYYLFRQIAAYERFIRQHFTFDFHYAICCSKGFVSLIWFPFPGRGPRTVNTPTHTSDNAVFVGHFGPTRGKDVPSSAGNYLQQPENGSPKGSKEEASSHTPRTLKICHRYTLKKTVCL